MQFDHLRIVLVGTSHPGNIGAVARAMKTMGLARLYLVEPKQFPCAEASARAAGATDVLAAARVCASLAEAIADCSLVVAASARLRSIPWPLVDAREAAALAIGRPSGEQVALVFGREKWGLSNEELEICNHLMQIQTNPDYGSLNLAAAVQILAYELRMAALGDEARTPLPPDSPPVTAKELADLYHHMEQTLVALRFINPAAPRQVMRRLKRLFNRAELEHTEANILRGILSKAQELVQRAESNRH